MTRGIQIGALILILVDGDSLSKRATRIAAENKGQEIVNLLLTWLLLVISALNRTIGLDKNTIDKDNVNDNDNDNYVATFPVSVQETLESPFEE